LRKNEGRVFFGGEHTMSPHAWIDTAMKSGVRVALEASNAKCGNVDDQPYQK
jgi:monoamine oxidase